MSSSRFTADHLVSGAIIIVCWFILASFAADAIDAHAFRVAQEKNHAVSVGSTSASFQPPAPKILDYQVTPNEPEQTEILDSERENGKFPFKGYDISKLAKFKSTAVLLSKHIYTAGEDEHRRVLAPCDFGLGWGPMSNPSVLNNFSYFQANRFFYYASTVAFSDQANRLQVDAHIANVHIIPSTDEIARALEKIQPRDVVTLEGELVQVSFRDQVLWRSSLSRTDTGDGACELLFLRRLSWVEQPISTRDVPLPASISEVKANTPGM